MGPHDWRKSSYSAEAANCVCVAVAPDGAVRLRDSKVPETVVAASAHALRTFIGAVVAGRLGRS
ncbi:MULTISPECIES: DUF397 domain-containing protein [unclassified Streptomyces]|uniref:DUF397 domain-containing protein n=1 Tax=unclassified Streptomyces TaxID=2593676 RepID=UPI001BE738AF|nr:MULTISPECIES: DUF397 domain-containing protein [unclassified Streptomyces]MBT2404502.1 DUF397 domain-containing protein [Streptomyces sp. ISL-21]MBT2456947.1 DUF397 domain-containing protein [Streptomyces sp. ISL-86]MBT2608793.1 DUF397 domain-containing protein [Streptomyces sp. ISL-87]